MDELDALAKLPKGPYSPKDRYHDFRKVFSTPEGQRVLREVISWCALLQPSVYGIPIDPNLFLLKEGEKNIGRRLLDTYLKEPPERPERTTRRK